MSDVNEIITRGQAERLARQTEQDLFFDVVELLERLLDSETAAALDTAIIAAINGGVSAESVKGMLLQRVKDRFDW